MKGGMGGCRGEWRPQYLELFFESGKSQGNVREFFSHQSVATLIYLKLIHVSKYFQQKNKTTPKSKNSLTPGGSKVSTPNSAASTPGRDSGTGTPVRLDENKSVSIKLAPPGSGIPNVVMIQNSGQNSVQKVSGQRPAVAKKRTAPRVPGVKRLHVGPALSIEKKQKIEMSAPPALCGMECPGKEGIPPTMHCGVCMCLFHPECVTFTPSSSGDAYLCQTCQNVTGMKVPNTTGPQTSGLSNGNLSLRAPPPLTPMQAPYGNNSDTHKVVTGLPPPPTLTLASGVSTNLTSALPNVISTARPSNVAQTINVSQLANQQQVSAHVLTLPSSIQNRVNISSPLSIRVNNQNIIVPPSCLISTPMGIKVFLPPGIVTNAMNMSGGESSFRATNVLTNTSDPQKFTIKDIEQGGREPVVDLVNDAPQSRSSSNSPITIPEVKTLDKSKIRIRKTRTNKIDPSQCHFQKLHGGFDCMFSIFEFLSVSDLLRASRVCRVWRNIASQHSLWRNVHLRGCRVSDWEAAAKCFNNFHTQKLDMRGMDHVEGDKNRTWHQFTAVLGEITMLQHIHFGPCPGIILHSVAEKLTNLRFLTAESISDATSEDQVWSSNTKLDIGKFKELKNLHELKLRGMGGLVMPAFSFSGGLPELSALTHLKRLSLTTLKDIPDSEFTFIGMLENLEELEMGDCSTWTETYAQLGNLQNLKRLRLECSGDSVDDKLAESLSKLKQLKTLELIKFVVTKSVCTVLNNMTQLRVMKVWPDIGSQTASCNSQTMAAVSTMTFLEILEWGIMMDKSTTPDNSENNNGQKEAASLESIPFLPVGGSTEKEGEEAGKNGENVDLMPEYINIGQLMDKLCDYLPDTKIRVFKVPVFNAGRKGQ